jgi:hypothetical protein
MTTTLQNPGKAGLPMLYHARSEAIESRRVKVRKMMARGFTAAQMASVLGIDREVIFKDISSVRKYIAKELQNSDTVAMVAESLGVFEEVRASALKDMDQANSAQERAIARRDVIRVEAERVKCLIMAAGGGPGRGMLNVTPATIEADPVPQLEDQHQKLMEVARNLANEVLLVGEPIPDSGTESNTEEASP